MDRRNLLRTSVVLGAAVALDGCKRNDDEKSVTEAKGTTADEPLVVLTAVAERILPSGGDGPGAKEANVGAFLANVLEDQRLAHLKPLLERGAAFLDAAAKAESKTEGAVVRFSTLSDEKKDDLLDRLGNRKMRPNGFDGTAFMRIMVALTLEGFLGDPKHGGNKDRAAWQWLGFDPNGRNAALHASAHGEPK